VALLSDKDLVLAYRNHQIDIIPWNSSQLQPASYDLRLASQFRYFRDWETQRDIDPKLVQEDSVLVSTQGEPYVLGPGQFVLGSTFERVSLPDNIGARYEGKSSIGRLGLLTHVTAGFIDPGFKGNITLELYNLRNRPIALYPGMRIGQICFYDLTSRAEKPYGWANNHYQEQSGPTPSAVHAQFEGE
jgi:dCTP deaminase